MPDPTRPIVIVNQAPAMAFGPRGGPTWFHIILCVISFGAWIPIWILCMILIPGSPRGYARVVTKRRRHPIWIIAQAVCTLAAIYWLLHNQSTINHSFLCQQFDSLPCTNPWGFVHGHWGPLPQLQQGVKYGTQ